MTYSQINQPKGWGFSRRTPNLKLSHLLDGRLTPKAIRGVPLNEQPSTRNSYITQVGDVTWLKTNMHISIRQSINLMSRLLLSAVAFIVSTTSTITLSGFQNIGRRYSHEVLCKVICHNICCVIMEMFCLGIKADFFIEERK